MGLIVTVASVAIAPGRRPADLLYQWATTALGNPSDPATTGVTAKVVGALGLICGALAVGLGTSLMSAMLIQRRTAEGMRRRAQRMRGHVVVVGLDELSAQVIARFDQLGIPAVLVEPGQALDLAALTETPDYRRVADMAPVLVGGLQEVLDHAQVDRAAALIACSKDNLVNVEACVRARRRSEDIRTVARIFDDNDIANAGLFGINEAIAAVEKAAPMFAAAALDEHPVREFGGGSDGAPPTPRLSAVVWGGAAAVGEKELSVWRGRGIRVLATRRRDGHADPLLPPRSLDVGDRALLVGPPEAIGWCLRPDEVVEVAEGDADAIVTNSAS
jgi:hypothetical protein